MKLENSFIELRAGWYFGHCRRPLCPPQTHQSPLNWNFPDLPHWLRLFHSLPILR